LNTTQNGRLTTAETDIDALQAYDIVLDGRLDTLEGQSLNSRLSSVEGINSTQNTRLDAIETLNTTQNTRLTSIETLNTSQGNRISALETTIDGGTP
jgi:hypothetical protein